MVGGQLRVLRNTGSAWVFIISSLDGVPNGTERIGSVSMARDASGKPWLTWLHVAGVSLTHMARFDGASFVDVPLPATVPSGHPAVGGDPVLAIGDGSSNVLRSHGGAWEAPVPVAVDGRGPIVAAPSNGALVIGVTGIGNGVATIMKVAFP
jgi:hypothetical protein